MKYYIITGIIIISFISGGVVGYKISHPKQEIKVIEVVKTVDKIVYRDYKKADLYKIAYQYDTTPMQLDYKILKLTPGYTDLGINWKLSEREGSQNIHVPVYQQGNWKFYVGIGIGAAVVGGVSYLGWRYLK